MAGDSIGQLFRFTNWGESHGKAIGGVLEGCPAGISLSEDDLQPALDRRRPGQSKIVTQRKEADAVEILSGLYEGKTTGTPISLMIRNQDQRSKDYSEMAQLYRPSHADFTYQQKYGIRDVAGGGRSSARVTAPTVAAGAIAEKILQQFCGVSIVAYVKSVAEIEYSNFDPLVTREQVEQSVVRCPELSIAEKMIQKIEATRKQGDSIGGVIECVIQSVPVGLGEPIFDKLEADLAKAMLSINASKGFEIGSGFAGTRLSGSEHNDPFINSNGTIATRSNYSGGIQGGISNGMPIVFRVAFKPTATIIQDQQTVNLEGEAVTFKAKGRHDPCVLPRAVPIVEAMAALTLCDHWLRYRGYQNLTSE
ncbi:chorismate synthase [Pleionea litopenaei]|uniref:Chorismate synthase n=1 Tax=Pleionea litopenaei TaxID=3070815 RepID=A0AA51RTN5_9GAMM|nr:chorismate synthase [Pleionea sp. HL-JVS1]WMS87417.1 chorismate synthase [Pleionea sp. HL-JVS1]